MPHPQLTPEESGVPSWVALGQGHLVLCLAQDGGEDAAEGPGAILSRRARSEARLRHLGPLLSRTPNLPGTLFSKLYLLRSRDSVALRSPWVRAPCQRWGSLYTLLTLFPTPLVRWPPNSSHDQPWPISLGPSPTTHQAL